ncbi:ABC transporter ATP-binding protein [Vibrio nigripulchritudo]|uniref:ABC transporter ATP-binding protein n=1 Tax=Vibrio nigripulchritudo TaxID=28173 RepID=UPI002493AF7A|nr:ABC transporter ATP-binding protein [Vibrio nigripulchritudo]BDU39369.1 ABC transporter ATPase [Vibrio nigripulchritudo]BDU45089.1 ABC transporter ATPase [Vibrio nigripulchritudo]
MITATNLSLKLEGKPVLKNIHLRVKAGEVIGIVGPNGSGKSTLLRVLSGIQKPDAGSVTIGDTSILKKSRRQMAQMVSFLPQERPVDFGQRVLDLVLLGRLCHSGLFSSQSNADLDYAMAALDKVGLKLSAYRKLSELSGGEIQRALIARVICQNSTCMLLDEPTNHLDLHYQFLILDLLRELKCTVIVVLHELNLASRYCDRVILLNEGAIHAEGHPKDIFTQDILAPVYNINVSRFETESGYVHLVVSDSLKKAI